MGNDEGRAAKVLDILNSPAILAAVLGLLGLFLDSRLDDLSQRVEGVRAEIGGVRAEIKDVRTEIKDVRTEIKDVRAEIQDVRTEIQDVRTDVADVNAKLARLEGQLAIDTRSVPAVPAAAMFAGPSAPYWLAATRASGPRCFSHGWY